MKMKESNTSMNTVALEDEVVKPGVLKDSVVVNISENDYQRLTIEIVEEALAQLEENRILQEKLKNCKPVFPVRRRKSTWNPKVQLTKFMASKAKSQRVLTTEEIYKLIDAIQYRKSERRLHASGATKRVRAVNTKDKAW